MANNLIAAGFRDWASLQGYIYHSVYVQRRASCMLCTRGPSVLHATSPAIMDYVYFQWPVTTRDYRATLRQYMSRYEGQWDTGFVCLYGHRWLGRFWGMTKPANTCCGHWMTNCTLQSLGHTINISIPTVIKTVNHAERIGVLCKRAWPEVGIVNRHAILVSKSLLHSAQSFGYKIPFPSFPKLFSSTSQSLLNMFYWSSFKGINSGHLSGLQGTTTIITITELQQSLMYFDCSWFDGPR
jgi:hypothetical protein